MTRHVLDELADPSSSAFSKELERLTKTAPERGIYPVTVDPRLNRTLAPLIVDSSTVDDARELIEKLGFNPPTIPDGLKLGGLGCYWLSDDDRENPGIAAWEIYDPQDEEP